MFTLGSYVTFTTNFRGLQTSLPMCLRPLLELLFPATIFTSHEQVLHYESPMFTAHTLTAKEEIGEGVEEDDKSTLHRIQLWGSILCVRGR